MPQNYSFPGVYVEEIPSGVRTIAGVSTSDTAFIDFFKKGLIDTPVRITSYGDFERAFGGLDTRSAASYAIQQFYLNGGSVAWVVRVAARDVSGISTAATASVTATAGGSDILAIDASSPGAWANDRIRVSLPAGAGTGQFNLKVEEVDGDDTSGVVLNTENYFNLSMDKSSARYAPNIVNASSTLVALRRLSLDTDNTVPTTIPASPNNRTDGGDDGTDVPGDTNWRTTTGAGALTGSDANKSGIHALDKIAPFVFNILCIPAAVDLEDADMGTVYSEAITYVETKRAFLILDIPDTVTTPALMQTWQSGHADARQQERRCLLPAPEHRRCAARQYRARYVGKRDSRRGLCPHRFSARRLESPRRNRSGAAQCQRHL